MWRTLYKTIVPTQSSVVSYTNQYKRSSGFHRIITLAFSYFEPLRGALTLRSIFPNPAWQALTFILPNLK